VILGKSFLISGFIYELILNIGKKVVRWHTFICFFRFTICIPFS